MSESDHHKPYVFICGSPRSGTTWTQLLLSQHPAVATSFETHLFSMSLGRLVDTYEHNKQSHFGLHSAVSDEEFMGLVRGFADGVMSRIDAMKPGASVVLEKSPSHVQYVDLIRQVYPEARLIHLVRDPRAVCASVLHAAGRGIPWAPRGPIGAARLWADSVRAGLHVNAPAEQFRELRYEALKADTAGELAALFEWLGLEATSAEVASYVEACAIENLQAGGEALLHQPWDVSRHRKFFFRRGLAEGWRDELSPAQVRAIEYEVGDLMDRLGYERASRHPRRVPPAQLVRRVTHAIQWRLTKVLKDFEARF